MNAEPRNDLIEDQHNPLRAAQIPHTLQVPGIRKDHAGVAHDRLHEHRGNLPWMCRHQPFQGGQVIPPRHQYLRNRRGRLARALQERNRLLVVGGWMRTDEQFVKPSMIMPGEPNDLRPPRIGTGEPHSSGDRL